MFEIVGRERAFTMITTASLPAGTYYPWVHRYNDTAVIASYQLDLTVH